MGLVGTTQAGSFTMQPTGSAAGKSLSEARGSQGHMSRDFPALRETRSLVAKPEHRILAGVGSQLCLPL